MTRDTYNCFYSLETTKIYKFKYYFKLNRNKSMNTSLYSGRSIGWEGGSYFHLKPLSCLTKKFNKALNCQPNVFSKSNILVSNGSTRFHWFLAKVQKLKTGHKNVIKTL